MFITIKGRKMYFEVYGSGTPLIFLHGWGADSRIWSSFQPYLSALPYQLIFLDLPGFGHSDLPGKPYHIEDYADDLNNFLTELEIRQPLLLGHSVGGEIAIAYTLKYKNSKKLVLIDSAGIKRRSLLTNLKIATAKSLKNKLPRLTHLAESFQSTDYKAAGPLKATMALIVEEDYRERLKEISTKTLVIWGENDPETPLRDAAIIHRQIKGSLLRIIPGSGHFPFLEQPAMVAGTIAEFLGDATP